MHDWVSGVIWHQSCDATLWIQLLCNIATLQPVTLEGAQFSQGGRASSGHPLEPPMHTDMLTRIHVVVKKYPFIYFRLSNTGHFQALKRICPQHSGNRQRTDGNRDEKIGGTNLTFFPS